MTFAIIVPTLNAAVDWERFCSALLVNANPDDVLILDSESTDRTVELARAAGFQVRKIPRAEFNHGGTRQFGAEQFVDRDVLVYMTQDAVLADATAIASLLRVF